jgi:hypothetical protein
MSSELIAVLFLLLDILVPIISGPVAAALYVRIMKNNNSNQQAIFWLGYVGWQVLVFYLMVFTLGDLTPGPGVVSCWLTPITAVLSFIILWRAEDGVRQATGADLAVRRNYQFGLFLIPIMQIVTLIVVLMLGPMMCEFGFRTCMTF